MKTSNGTFYKSTREQYVDYKNDTDPILIKKGDLLWEYRGMIFKCNSDVNNFRTVIQNLMPILYTKDSNYVNIMKTPDQYNNMFYVISGIIMTNADFINKLDKYINGAYLKLPEKQLISKGLKAI